MFQSKRPLVYLFTVVFGMSLVAQQQSTGIFSAFASESSPRESGYDHGCDDAGISDPGERYINQPEKGPSFHTGEFMAGYNDGFDSCEGNGGGEPNVPEPDFGDNQQTPPQQGGINWVSLCSDLQVALVSSCTDLVNSDNTLTQEGDRAVGCIRNGILLAGGGSFLLHLPLPAIGAALQFLEGPTGCDGIVNWGLMGSVGDLRSVINRLT